MDIRLLSSVFSLTLFSATTCMIGNIPRSKSCDSLATLAKLSEFSNRKAGISDTEHWKYAVLSEEEPFPSASVLAPSSTKNEEQILLPLPDMCNEIAQNDEEEDAGQEGLPLIERSLKQDSIISAGRIRKGQRRRTEVYKPRLSINSMQPFDRSQINSYYRSDMEDEDEVKSHEPHPTMKSHYYQSDMEEVEARVRQGNLPRLFPATQQEFIQQISVNPVFSTALQKLQSSDEPVQISLQESSKTSANISAQISLDLTPNENMLQRLSGAPTEDEDDQRPRLVLIANISHAMPRQTRIILSISGGGSRGIIPAIFLRELRSHLFPDAVDYWAPKLPIDLYAGTSVGALIATAENIGQMQEVCLNFRNMSQRIFHKNWWNKLLSIVTFGAMGTYDPNGRLDVIKEMLGGKDGKDLETEQLIPLYILNIREDYLYNSKKSHMSLVDALMGTSAAPTYFPPHVVHVSPTENRTLLDGGLWKNRPDALAYFHARAQYPNDYIKIIAIGTGKTSKVDNYDNYPVSLLGWASRFVDIAMDSSNQDAMIMIRRAQKFDPYLKYYDLNVELDRSDIKTDETDLSFFDRLTNATVLATKNPQSDFNAALEALQEKLSSTR